MSLHALDPARAATCMRCPQFGPCRLWRDPAAQCEHWPVATLPGLPTLAGRLLVATVKHVRAGGRKVSAEQLQERQAHCLGGCTHWDAEAFSGRGRCRHHACGCSGIKLEWPSQACPMGKWQAVV